METHAVDKTVLDELLASLEGDTAFLGELSATFLSDAPSLLAQLNAALAAGDADAFRRGAHSLKSSSASLGAHDLSRAAKELELMGKAGNLEGAGAQMAEVEAEYARVRDELIRVTKTG